MVDAKRKCALALRLGPILDAGGQAASYLLGMGKSAERLAVFELDRLKHLTAYDRRQFQPL